MLRNVHGTTPHSSLTNCATRCAHSQERKQLAKIEARQQHEIEQMLAYEQQMRERREEAERKLQVEQEREDKLKREKRRRAAQVGYSSTPHAPHAACGLGTHALTFLFCFVLFCFVLFCFCCVPLSAVSPGTHVCPPFLLPARRLLLFAA